MNYDSLTGAAVSKKKKWKFLKNVVFLNLHKAENKILILLDEKSQLKNLNWKIRNVALATYWKKRND